MPVALPVALPVIVPTKCTVYVVLGKNGVVAIKKARLFYNCVPFEITNDANGVDDPAAVTVKLVVVNVVEFSLATLIGKAGVVTLAG